jgi:hypothetical protein
MSVTTTAIETMNAPERQPPGIRLTEQQQRARRARSIAIALALGAFVLVIFAVTMVKLKSGTLSGDDYMRPVQTTK